jgi:hypothetical protein
MATDFLTATLGGDPTVLLEVDGLRLLPDPTFVRRDSLMRSRPDTFLFASDAG